MKRTMNKMTMLLCVAAIATGVISCENKAKEEAEKAAKQELLIKQKEKAARLEQARIEQQRIEQERAKNLIITPPKSVSDLRDRIIGTRWKVEHSDSDGIYPIFEFNGSMVYGYLVHRGNKELYIEDSYTVKEDSKSDCFLIEFGDDSDMAHLKKIFIFVKGTDAVVLYEPMTGARDNLQLLN